MTFLIIVFIVSMIGMFMAMGELENKKKEKYNEDKKGDD